MAYFPQAFPTNTLCTTLSSPIRAMCPAHFIRLDFTTYTILGNVYRSFSSSLCSFLHSHVTPSLLGPNTFLNTLFSNTLNLRSYLNVSDQVSHPYKITGKIIVLYILIFNFLDSYCLLRGLSQETSTYYSCAVVIFSNNQSSETHMLQISVDGISTFNFVFG
jgi:hypothetical protein